MKISTLSRLIEISFYLLFFLVPLILTPWNFELFEFNKMLLTYGLTTIICSIWLIKIISEKRLQLNKTPLDLPILIFLLSQIISTVFSIDRHVSIFGYYSRFNGGLLSSISYILLYYAFINNFPKDKLADLLKYSLASGFLVSIYGVLEHFGIDKNIWVQDVQNRVFSSLGQPNWLAAYLAILIPVSLSFILNSKFLLLNSVLNILFFLTLIFTKSRSGFLGLGLGLFVFWLINVLIYKRKFLKLFLILNSCFLILIFLFGAPFQPFNHLTISNLFTTNKNNKEIAPKPNGSSIIDIGITESGTIRNIVWRGAIDILKNNPVFGTGPETFAFSYFKFRPVEHNMTSEWDFLYNKAHNEYLNYAANSGILGFGSYLLIIFTFIFWFIKNFHRPRPKADQPMAETTNDQPASPARLAAERAGGRLMTGLFSGWLTILVTNFFGFSVVIIQLFFFLIPAILFILLNSSSNDQRPTTNLPRRQAGDQRLTFGQGQKILTLAVTLFGIYLLFRILILWLADYYFAIGNQKSRIEDYTESYNKIKQAISLNNNEPNYYDELSFPALQIGLSLAVEGQSTHSAELINEAIDANNQALNISPKNVNFWKTRTRVLYSLTQINESYLNQALESLEIAKGLSPTDPKIRYNLSLIYDAAGEKEKAYRSLEETIKLKINYRDAYLARAVFYIRDGNQEKAKEALNFILTRINPDDNEAKQQLEEIK